MASNINICGDGLILRKVVAGFSEENGIVPHAVAFRPADAEGIVCNVLELCDQHKTGAEDQRAVKQGGKMDFFLLLPEPGCEYREKSAEKDPDPQSAVWFTGMDEIVKYSRDQAEQNRDDAAENERMVFQLPDRRKPSRSPDQHQGEERSEGKNAADRDERGNDAALLQKFGIAFVNSPAALNCAYE